jgi:hypothetical protein
MALEDLLSLPGETALEIATSLGSIAIWLKTLGLLAIIWIVLTVANWLMNRKRLKEVYEIRKDMVRIEGKLDKAIKKK